MKNKQNMYSIRRVFSLVLLLVMIFTTITTDYMFVKADKNNVMAAPVGSAEVTTFDQLKAAFLDATVNVIVIAADIDIPCEIGNVTNNGKSISAALVADRSLTIVGKDNHPYILKRTSTVDRDSKCKSILEVNGNNVYDDIQVTLKNVILDGGTIWPSDVSLKDRGKGTNIGLSGRSIIDVANKGTINLGEGCVVRNNMITCNSQTNQTPVYISSGTYSYGGGVRVEYESGGTVNLMEGATIEDTTADNVGGAIGAYNYGRINVYGGVIRRTSVIGKDSTGNINGKGGAICCTYRKNTDKTTAAIVKVYDITIENCYASNALIMVEGGNPTASELHAAKVSDSTGSLFYAASASRLRIANYDEEKFKIRNLSTETANGKSYTGCGFSADKGIRYSGSEGNLIITLDSYEVAFFDEEELYTKLYLLKNTAAGKEFPAEPVKPGYIFINWQNSKDASEVTDKTVFTEDTRVNAHWEEHIWKIVAENNKVTATCNTGICQDKNTVASLTLKANDMMYSKEPYDKAMLVSDGWEKTGINYSEFVYINANTNEVLDSVPTEVGKYIVYLAIGDEVNGYSYISTKFSITPEIHEKGTKHEAAPATCSKVGTVEFYECINCGCYIDENGNVIDDINTLIDENAHDWGPYVVSANMLGCSRTCKYDNAHVESNVHTGDICVKCGWINPMHKHIYNEVSKVEAVAPSCEKTGNIEYYTCSLCNVPLDNDGNVVDPVIPINPDAHRFEAFYSSDSEYHWYSAACSHSEQKKNIEKHSFDRNGKCIICDSGNVAYKNHYATYYDTIMTVEYGMSKGKPKGLSLSDVNGVVTVNAGINIMLPAAKWTVEGCRNNRTITVSDNSTWLYADKTKSDSKNLKKYAFVKYNKKKNESKILFRSNKKVEGGVYSVKLVDDRGNVVIANIEVPCIPKSISKDKLKINSDITNASKTDVLTKGNLVGLVLNGTTDESLFNDNAVKWQVGSGKKAKAVNADMPLAIVNKKGTIGFLVLTGDGRLKILAGNSSGSIKLKAVVNKKSYSVTIKVIK